MIKIDISDETALIEYEKYLFRAFPYQKNTNMENYFNIDLKARRYSPVIPYSDFKIFINKPASLILSSVSVQPVSNNKLQLEIDGFTVDKSEPSACEGFNLSNIGDATMFRNFLGEVLLQLKSDNFSKCYITCYEKRVVQYQHEGFTFLKSITKENGFVINLMCFDLVNGQVGG